MNFMKALRSGVGLLMFAQICVYVRADTHCFTQAALNATLNGPGVEVMLAECPAGLSLEWWFYPTVGSNLGPQNASFVFFINETIADKPNLYQGRGYTVTAAALMACYIGNNTDTNHIASDNVSNIWTNSDIYDEEYEWVSTPQQSSETTPNITFQYTIPNIPTCNTTTYDAQVQFIDENNTQWILILDSPGEMISSPEPEEEVPEEGENFDWLIILLTLLLAGAIIIAGIFYVGNRKLRKAIGKDGFGPFNQAYPKNAPAPSDDPDALMMVKGQAGPIDASQFVMLEIIGRGEFGAVYKGALFYEKKAAIVAIKTLKPEHRNEEHTSEQFHAEAEIMKSLNHPNVVSLIGMSSLESDDGVYECLIMEYMALGDLRSYIKNTSGPKESEPGETTNYNTSGLTAHEKLWHCLQIARGMEYLASVNLVHRDLAARNCMLALPTHSSEQGMHNDYSFTAQEGYPITKIADFGLARIYDENEREYVMSNSTLLPVRWLSIEAITERSYTEKSDVWAFAVTCWEVFSDAKVPYEDLSTFNLAASVASGTRPKKPTACPPVVFDVMQSGWEQDINIRPNFVTLREKLEKIFFEVSMEDMQNIDIFNEKSTVSMPNVAGNELGKYQLLDHGHEPLNSSYPFQTATDKNYVDLNDDHHESFLSDAKSPHTLLSRKMKDVVDDIYEEDGYVAMEHNEISVGSARTMQTRPDSMTNPMSIGQTRTVSSPDVNIYLDGDLDAAFDGAFNTNRPHSREFAISSENPCT
eukprot:CFRG3868T1